VPCCHYASARGVRKRLGCPGRIQWSHPLTGCFKALWDDRGGSVSIEYGLIAVLISIGIIGASQLIALDLSSIFGEVEVGLSNR
jgi:Flp pilus assembly pilin Flp